MPFKVRKYGAHKVKQLSAHQEAQSSSNTQKFSDLIKDYENLYQINQYTSIIRNNIIKEVESPTCPLIFKMKPQEINGIVDNQIVKSPIDDLKCLKINKVKVNKSIEPNSIVSNNNKQDWHHPQKAVFKPFIQVNVYFLCLSFYVN